MFKEDYERVRFDERDDDNVYSKQVKAGKRTYFFDVKATKGNKDYFLVIGERKRRLNQDGSYTIEKHKIYLYKEDFDKFAEGFNEVLDYVKDNCLSKLPTGEPASESIDIEFEEL